MSRRFLSFATLFLLTLGVTLGCSSNKSNPAEVSGKVTYKGEPVTGGTIVFYTANGAYSAGLLSDGTYSLTDLPEGDCTITINTEELNPNRKQPTYDPAHVPTGGAAGGKYKTAPTPSPGGGGGKVKQTVSPAGEGSPQGERGQYVKIPPQYADKDKSTLKATLKSGSQNINFDLTD